jgi:hypothetical protein
VIATAAAATGVAACHGPAVGGPLVDGGAGGSGGAGGLAAGTGGGRPGSGGAAAGSGGAAGTGGRSSGTGGAAGTGGRGSGTGGGGGGASLAALAIVPGTGAPGIGYRNMMAVDRGIAYVAVLDPLAGAGALSPRVIVKAIALSTGAATTLSAATEAASILAEDSAPIAVDGTHAYWFSRTQGEAFMRLRRALKTGGGHEDVVAFEDNPGPVRPRAVATGGAHVYWATKGNGLWRCQAGAGCPGGPQLLAPSTDDIHALVVRGDWLYWASATNGKVWRRNLTSPAGDQMLDGGPTQALGQTCGLAVAADDTELFSIQCLWPYEVRRVNVSLMSGSMIANATAETVDETAGGSIALAPDLVYFMGSDHVFSVGRSGGAAAKPLASVVAAGSNVRAQSIVGLDDQYVYLQGMSDSQAGVVLRLAR